MGVRRHIDMDQARRGEPAAFAPAARTGSRVATVDGAFVDFCHGWGAALLGWNDPEVEAAAKSPNPGDFDGLAGRLAARLAYAEAVAVRGEFPKLLADVLSTAKRVTGREAAWYCDFAGPLDLDQAQRLIADAPGGVAAMVVDTLEAAPTVLADLRWLADRTGAVLIFDESRTAARVHPAGAFGLSGVEPDAALLGSGLANCRPIAAVCGRRALIDALPDGEAPKASALAAACVALDRMERLDAAAAVRVAGAEISAELGGVLRRTGADARLQITGDPSWLRIVARPHEDGRAAALSAFVEAALFDRGVIAPSVFIPAWTTGDREIGALVAACAEAFSAALDAVETDRFERPARVRRFA